MKKMFQAMTCLAVFICAAYGAYILVRKFLSVNKHKFEESSEFDELYDEFISGQGKN